NQGTAFFVVGDRSPYHAELVTTDGSDYDKGVISSGQKGRGLGDCWSFESLTWNGKQFVQSASSSTGMCRLIAPGGAWDLPDFVTEVRHAAQ
ncbi:MAG: DUF1176 domain-containing protein, partial [Burkholderiales bacterium]|nr:DUF1176 domain-containing protein [Burkholderiales bacterium]